jgi:ubiquinone/menaquinone biosynthesis C-methylase UbiE
MASEPHDMHQMFEDWYAAMPGSPRKDEIVQRHLGLPPELLSTSLLTWDGLADVTDALSLEPGQLLLDLACGRGGYGLELAARTGARLIGVDFAAEAIRQAVELAAHRGIDAAFRVGDLTATGLPDGCADAAVVVDAIQFPPDPAAAYAELARVLRPGGRVVLTCWEALDRSDEAVHEGLRRVDLAGGLTSAGFVDVEVREKPSWTEAERALWTEAKTLEVGDDQALADLKEEAEAVLPEFGTTRRVMASAVCPS